MLTAIRRIALGIAVVAVASAILLLSDLQHRERAARRALTKKKTWKIYFVQYNDVIDVKDAERGVLDGLRESGLEDGRDYEVQILNAQGDMATVSALIDSAITGGADMLITFSTPTLQAALRRAHLPVFAFQKSQAIGGAMVVVARDYNDSGRHAAHLAARIMRGENPKKIPLEDFAKTSLIVNLDAARALDITLPPALVQSAKDVIGDANGNR